MVMPHKWKWAEEGKRDQERGWHRTLAIIAELLRVYLGYPPRFQVSARDREAVLAVLRRCAE